MNIFTSILILLIAIAVKADNIVKTTNGPIRGKAEESGEVEAFLGIPYAEPPVGPLRFKKPSPKAPWDDVFDANEFPNSCIQAMIAPAFTQGITDLSEDCLYLNIWVPHAENKSELKPIILFIHGGGFMFGSSSILSYDGAALAKHGDVIVATINYRLGGLGFFTGFIDDAPGNMGMHDQVAAIRWIKENAEVFQGDPNNIVLMGESAGSFSVSAHLLSPLSKNLFRRGVLLSGSVLHPTISDNNNKLSKQCQRYANFLGCTPNDETLENDSVSITECMKNLPPEKFAEADMKILVNQENYPQDLYNQMIFPRVGDDFLPENTVDSFRKGNFKDAEILIGITRDEGSLLLVFFTPKLFGKLQNILTPVLNETITRDFMKHIIGSEDESEDDKIIKSYMDHIKENEEYAYIKALREVFGDYIISCSAVFQADIQSLQNNPVYFYVFNFLPSAAPSARFFPKWFGVPHAEELQYIFGNFHMRKYSEMEKEFARDLMDRLVAFAKTGNPNPPNSVEWPRYTFEDPKYLELNDKDTLKIKPNGDRCEVWRKRFGSIIDDDLIEKLKKSEL